MSSIAHQTCSIRTYIVLFRSNIAPESFRIEVAMEPQVATKCVCLEHTKESRAVSTWCRLQPSREPGARHQAEPIIVLLNSALFHLLPAWRPGELQQLLPPIRSWKRICSRWLSLRYLGKIWGPSWVFASTKIELPRARRSRQYLLCPSDNY